TVRKTSPHQTAVVSQGDRVSDSRPARAYGRGILTEGEFVDSLGVEEATSKVWPSDHAREQGEMFSSYGEAPMRLFLSACSLTILSSTVLPGPTEWEVVRSMDGDFAFSMPLKPTLEKRDVQGAIGMLEILEYSCQFNGSTYLL